MQVVEADKKEDADVEKLPDDLRKLTLYPEPMMTDEQVRNGGFLLYVCGKSRKSNGSGFCTESSAHSSWGVRI